MQRIRELKTRARAPLARFVIVALLGIMPATSSLAQAPGYVRVKLVKAGLMVAS